MTPRGGVRHGSSKTFDLDQSRAVKPDEDGVVRIPVTMHWLWAPLGLFFILPLPALIGSLLIPDSQFREMFGQRSFLTEPTVLTAVGYAAIFLAVFALMVPPAGSKPRMMELDARSQVWVSRTLKVLAWITFVAYAVWLGNAVLRGLNVSTVISLLSGEEGAMYTLRNRYFESLSGVTTWMQLSALVAPIAVLQSKLTGRSPRKILIWLFALALVRALLNSERLALIEIVLSTVLAYLILREKPPQIVRSPVSALLLIVGAWGLLILVFGIFEYFRSWTTQDQTSEGGFWVYAVTLLIGYYATALNLAAFDASLLQGESYASALFQGSIYQQLFGPSPLAGAQNEYGLETFTNRSGLLVPNLAFGTVGGAVVILVTALVLAGLARGAAKGSVVAMIVYCASAVAVLEVVRIYYFGSSRFLPVLIASVVMAISWGLMKARPTPRGRGN